MALTEYGKFAIIAARQKVAKPVIWIKGSRDQLHEMPPPVRLAFGHALWEVQVGDAPLDMKALPSLGGGVCELRESFDGNAFRLMYVAKLKKGVYVLDVLMKKSKSGIGLPKMDVERIKARYREALKLDAKE